MLTLSDEASSSINARWVELDEFEILQGQTCTSDHSVTITSASVCTCTAEISATVTTGRKNGLVGTETVKSAVFHVESNNADTLAVLHNQVEREVLNEEVGVVPKRLAIKRVEKSMTGSVSGGSTSVCLTTLSIFERLATECTLVDLALLSSRERNTEVLELSRLSDA